MDLQQAFDAGFEAVKAYVDAEIGALAARLAELEQREVPAAPELPDIPALVAEAVAALPPAKPGKDADPEVTAALVREEVGKAIAALPVPQDGQSVTVEDVEPLIRSCVSTAVSEAVKGIPVPKDGKDGRDGLDVVTPILKDGVLIFTMSDGSVKEVGRVRGEDGKDGAPGKDGADGVGFDDMDLVESEDGVFLRFVRGETVKEFRLPVVRDCGVWQARDAGYRKGDGVTWGGSFWIATEDTAEKPDSGKGWRLAVKKGRDAREPAKVA